MTVRGMVERPRILAHLTSHPGCTVNEITAALGYGQAKASRIRELVSQLWHRGAVVCGTEARDAGRKVQVWWVAPPGTPRPPRGASPEAAARRRYRQRMQQRWPRAQRQGIRVPAAAPVPVRIHAVRPPAPAPRWTGTGPRCQGADPALFFPGPGESGAEAKAICASCPVRRSCLAGAIDRREPWGIGGGVNFETVRALARPA